MTCDTRDKRVIISCRVHAWRGAALWWLRRRLPTFLMRHPLFPNCGRLKWWLLFHASNENGNWENDILLTLLLMNSVLTRFVHFEAFIFFFSRFFRRRSDSSQPRSLQNFKLRLWYLLFDDIGWFLRRFHLVFSESSCFLERKKFYYRKQRQMATFGHWQYHQN